MPDDSEPAIIINIDFKKFIQLCAWRQDLGFDPGMNFKQFLLLNASTDLPELNKVSISVNLLYISENDNPNP